jgi:ribosomal-protein-alanine N-acetyltransferase
MSRVFLRKPVLEDCQELLSLHQKSQAFHFPWVFPALTEEACQAYLDRCLREDFEGLLICQSSDRRIMGVAKSQSNFLRIFSECLSRLLC